MLDNNIGLYLTNNSDKNLIIEQILENCFLRNHLDLATLNGELYSQITIDKMIDEELRHDAFVICTNENYGLVTMSNGQQKKALLAFIISKKPDFIVLDDIYSNIDKETQQSITATLNKLGETTLLIQLFYRKKDILSCIHTIYSVDHNNSIVSKQTDEQFVAQQSSPAFDSTHKLLLPTLFAQTNPLHNPLIQFNSVCSAYGHKPVLKDICWTINNGEFWHLIGPNGSGKSTLLSLITGDNPRAYGQNLVLFGRKKGTGETLWDIKKKIGYFTPTMIFQFTHGDSVENMLISGLVDSVGLYTIPTDLQKDIAQSWLTVLGESFQNRMFNSLSPGQQRIVLVVRALIKYPPLLILDEPTVGLDDENSELFISLIHSIAALERIAILYVSHRDEVGLHPNKIFELVPTIEGSMGIER